MDRVHRMTVILCKMLAAEQIFLGLGEQVRGLPGPKIRTWGTRQPQVLRLRCAQDDWFVG